VGNYLFVTNLVRIKENKKLKNNFFCAGENKNVRQKTHFQRVIVVNYQPVLIKRMLNKSKRLHFDRQPI